MANRSPTDPGFDPRVAYPAPIQRDIAPYMRPDPRQPEESTMLERHFMKLRARATLTAEHEQAIRGLISETRDHPADKVVVPAYVEQTHSTLLLEGFICRYKDLTNGRRQITQIHVPGDFVDLHSFTLKYLDHDIMTLTPAKVAHFPHEGLRRVTEQFPALTRIYWFNTNLDAAIHREWELSLGRRKARGRVAMLLSELQLRLELVGLADETGFAFPLTQVEISECTGLTNVHVNRTVRELREAGVVELRRGRVDVLDKEALWREAEFDPRYLYLQKRER
ncbi:Crp/Fnr family transcriptional regulator [Novosphingobium sp. 9U]|uniref:Crp/Fnr family transcriptional regulator n=1 Tax=Novosphingobium sp. 9U TaxID=2653158 RepID=UPI0012F02A4E|nr:Crp/Fnr family transcriptional regulator [Novosphingobium sp. 9U]VWX53151.1 Crp/Fnr family transcriptional regulator [Novosphingobium sp. 9U]